LIVWLRGQDLNLRPSGYEAERGHSTPLLFNNLQRWPKRFLVYSSHSLGTPNQDWSQFLFRLEGRIEPVDLSPWPFVLGPSCFVQTRHRPNTHGQVRRTQRGYRCFIARSDFRIRSRVAVIASKCPPDSAIGALDDGFRPAPWLAIEWSGPHGVRWVENVCIVLRRAPSTS